jgi:hypothetical protein
MKKRHGARAVAVLAVALGLSSGIAAPAAAVPLSEGPYYVRNLGTMRCLDAFYSGGGVNGNPVGLWDCNNGITERWRLVKRGDSGYPYQLINMRSGLCLDYEAASGGEPGARFKLWGCNGSPAQSLHYNLNDRFQVQSSERGAYNGMMMDAYASGGGGNGNPVGIWPYTGSPLQRWQLERAN